MQPQSDEEIRAFVEQLRAAVNDPLLDIRWNAKAVMLAPGSYSVLGQRIDGRYDGRWQIIRYDDPTRGHAGLNPERGYTVICTVTELCEQEGILYMVPLREGGAYMPICDRLITFMRQCDSQNTAYFEELRKKVWAQHDRAEADLDKLDDSAAIEALDHVHFQGNYAGGVGNWQGKGADFAAMERAAHTSGATQRILTVRR